MKEEMDGRSGLDKTSNWCWRQSGVGMMMMEQERNGIQTRQSDERNWDGIQTELSREKRGKKELVITFTVRDMDSKGR